MSINETHIIMRLEVRKQQLQHVARGAASVAYRRLSICPVQNPCLMEPATSPARQQPNRLDRCLLRYNSQTDLCTHALSKQPNSILCYFGIEEATEKMKCIGLFVGAEDRHQHLSTKWWQCIKLPLFTSVCMLLLFMGFWFGLVLRKDLFLLRRLHIRESQCSSLPTATYMALSLTLLWT